jgi:hypothetical protein
MYKHGMNRRSGGCQVQTTGASMLIPQSAGEIIGKHVTLELEAIDRMYLNIYVPALQREQGTVNFFKYHRKQPIPSSVLMGQMTQQFVASVERFVKEHGIEVVRFAKGQRKDAVMLERLKKFAPEEGIVFLGIAQEKARIPRTERRRNADTGKTYPWIVKSTAVVNHYYFYCVDKDFGPFFLKFCSYFPYNAKLCINGHEYLKRQLANNDICYEALDNGILSCSEPKRAQEMCDHLSADKIDRLLRKWLRLLPHPFTGKDRQAGYRYDVSILQSEFSLTQVLEQPVMGRKFFEEVIRENIDIGRPDQVQLIFERRVTRRTPGRFRTRIITEGVTPSLHVDYKHTRIKQYHKESQALRTETTVNDTYDFGIGKRLKNLPALRKVGFSANRRLLGVQCISHDCSLGETTFSEINSAKRVDDQRVSALRFGDPTVQALLSVILLFVLIPCGFTNREIREHLAQLLGVMPANVTRGKMTYNLRRLKHHGIIEKIPHTNRYRVTANGLRIAVIYTRAYQRVLRLPISLAFQQHLAASPPPIRKAFTKLNGEVENLFDHLKLTA